MHSMKYNKVVAVPDNPFWGDAGKALEFSVMWTYTDTLMYTGRGNPVTPVLGYLRYVVHTVFYVLKAIAPPGFVNPVLKLVHGLCFDDLICQGIPLIHHPATEYISFEECTTVVFLYLKKSFNNLASSLRVHRIMWSSKLP